LVSGYPGIREINLAMQRGEIDGGCAIANSSISSHWLPDLKSGKLKLIVLMAPKKTDEFGPVPSVYDYASSHEERQVMDLFLLYRPLAAPSDVPPMRLATLRKAFMATMADRAFLADTEKAIIQALTTNLTDKSPAAPPSMMELFTQERQKLGLEPLEAELAGLDAEIDRINAAALVGTDKIDDRTISNEARSLRKSQVAKDAQRELAFLQVEKAALARQIDNKMSAVQMTMQFMQQDFANASAAYNSEFSRSMQMIDLFTGLQDRDDAKEDRQERKQDKLADNARANLQTVTNLIKDSGKSFADLDENQKRNIRQWEVQAGLPQGTYETFAQAMPQAKILHTSSGTDAAGRGIVTFIYDDGTGKPGVVEVVGTGSRSSAGGGGVESPTKSGTLVYTASDRSDDSKALEASRGEDGYVDPSLYQKLSQEWVKAGGSISDFVKDYPPKNYVNPANTWLPAYLRPTSGGGDLFENL
jgi:hypothetical protein